MPLSKISTDIYLILKRKTPLHPLAVYDANINITNLGSYKTEGMLHILGDIVPLKKSSAPGMNIYSNGVLLDKFLLKVERGRLILDINLPWKPYLDILEFYLEIKKGYEDHLGKIQLSYLTEMKEFEDISLEKSQHISPPPPDIVFLTQGNHQVDTYLRSGPQGVYKLMKMLADVGLPFNEIRTILDFGCGSGRMMRVLHAIDPTRQIYGTDCCDRLIEWSIQHFPPGVFFCKNELFPPLPFKDEQFDLVYLLSVFTHLPLDCQKKWLEEFKRVLKKGKPLIVTLQGMGYLHYFKHELPDVYEKLMKNGYADSDMTTPGVQPGSNSFFTVHLPEFAVSNLFKDWDTIAYFPGGKFRNYLATLGILGFAGIQDIYILTH